MALGACAALGLAGMRGSPVPFLSLVDHSFHELGHLVSTLLPLNDLMEAAAGSFAQIAIPFALALYFLFVRPDRIGLAVCLAWTATATADVARYIADAPTRSLPLIGREHEWAYIFGREGIDALDAAAGMAATVSGAAWLVFALAVASPAWGLLCDLRRRGSRTSARRHAGGSLDLRAPQPWSLDLRTPATGSLDLREVASPATAARSRPVGRAVPDSSDGRRRPPV